MHRLLIIFDVCRTMPDGSTDGWAYFRRGTSLAHFKPDDFEVDLIGTPALLRTQPRLRDYDCVFLLDYSSVRPVRHAITRARAECPLVVSFNADRYRRQEMWAQIYRDADAVIVNNRCCWEFRKRTKRTYQISNGVDPRWWFPTVPIEDRKHRVLWCGSSSKGKGYSDVLLPAQERLEKLGFECSFRPVDDINSPDFYGIERQREWFNSGSYILSASASEGTPGTSLDGMSCGCVLVSTWRGNVLEFGRDAENCVVIERDAESLIRGLVYARENRERLSATGLKTIEPWSYEHRAKAYFWLFRELIAGRKPAPFSYDQMPEGSYG